MLGDEQDVTCASKETWPGGQGHINHRGEDGFSTFPSSYLSPSFTSTHTHTLSFIPPPSFLFLLFTSFPSPSSPSSLLSLLQYGVPSSIQYISSCADLFGGRQRLGHPSVWYVLLGSLFSSFHPFSHLLPVDPASTPVDEAKRQAMENESHLQSIFGAVRRQIREWGSEDAARWKIDLTLLPNEEDPEALPSIRKLQTPLPWLLVPTHPLPLLLPQVIWPLNLRSNWLQGSLVPLLICRLIPLLLTSVYW